MEKDCVLFVMKMNEEQVASCYLDLKTMLLIEEKVYVDDLNLWKFTLSLLRESFEGVEEVETPIEKPVIGFIYQEVDDEALNLEFLAKTKELTRKIKDLFLKQYERTMSDFNNSMVLSLKFNG